MKEDMKTTVSKNKEGYGYKYTDLAQIHEYLEGIGARYYQYIDRIDNDDYIMTVPIIDGKELPARRGVKIVDAVLNGVKNPAQEQGSATTYARRYSLLMAFGLATEDDDAASLTRKKKSNEKEQQRIYDLMVKINELAIEKNIDFEEIRNKYNVKSSKDMTLDQLNDCVEWLKGVK